MDALWFIDISGGEAGLISGYSSAEDSACMLGVVHITLAALNCRVWWEHVPSEVNPSDGLSRGGLLDEWTLSQDWDIREVSLPDWSNLKDLPLDTLLGKFAEVTARLPEANVEQAPVEWKIPQVPPSELERLLAEDVITLGSSRVEFTVKNPLSRAASLDKVPRPTASLLPWLAVVVLLHLPQHLLQQLLLDVSGLQIGDGTPQIQKLVIARQLIGREHVG